MNVLYLKNLIAILLAIGFIFIVENFFSTITINKNVLILFCLFLTLKYCFNITLHSQISRETNQRRLDAEILLKKNGLTPHYYFPAMGVEDIELKRAIVEFYSGFIIENAHGEIIGKTASMATQEHKKPHLRMVISRAAPTIAQERKKSHLRTVISN